MNDASKLVQESLHRHIEARVQAEGVRVREECAKHPLHLIFAQGSMVRAYCACGVKFDVNRNQCWQWSEHVRSLPLPTAAYEEAMLRARIGEHHIFCELCTNMREPTDEKCCPSMKEMQRDLAELAAREQQK